MAKKTTLKKQDTTTAETAEQAVKTNTTALRAVMHRNGETLAQLADLLGLTEIQLRKKLEASSFTAKEINTIKDHYRLSAEQMDLIFFTVYELKALKRKAEKGLKRIGKGTRGYDLKMTDLIAGYENVRHGDYLDTLRIMYYSGLESGYRMAEKQQQKQSS